MMQALLALNLVISPSLNVNSQGRYNQLNVISPSINSFEDFESLVAFAKECLEYSLLPASYQEEIKVAFNNLLEVCNPENFLPYGKIVWESRDAERDMNEALNDSMSGVIEIIYGIYRITKGDIAGGGMAVADGLRKIIISAGEFEDAARKEREAKQKIS